MTTRQTIRIFLASPGDVLEERERFREILRSLSVELPHDFEPLGRESVKAKTGARPQDQINQLVDRCDVFIGVFHKRWGQASPDSVASSSYTEEEFNRARRRLAETGSPEIFLFFRHVDLSSLSDPGPQLSKVLKFRRQVEASNAILYRTFSTLSEFEEEVRMHLEPIARDLQALQVANPRSVRLPDLDDLDPERNWKGDLALAHQAQEAAEHGSQEVAALLYAQLSQETRNIEVLEQAQLFFGDSGNQEAAAAVLETKLSLLQDRRIAAREHLAVMNLRGWIDEMAGSMVLQLAPDIRNKAAGRIRDVLESPRFSELLIEALADNFSVGELSSLSRFYRGEGSTITSKMGRFMGRTMPRIFTTLREEGRISW